MLCLHAIPFADEITLNTYYCRKKHCDACVTYQYASRPRHIYCRHRPVLYQDCSEPSITGVYHNAFQDDVIWHSYADWVQDVLANTNACLPPFVIDEEIH